MMLQKVNKDKPTSTNSSRCLNCKIRSHSFCRAMKEEDIEDFSCISLEKIFKNKENIFLQEDVANNLFNVTSGNVKIYKLLNDGRIQIIGFLYPGDFFGSYNNNKYNYSAEAIGEVKVCSFLKSDINLFIEKNIMLAKGLLHQTSHELNLVQDRIRVLGKLNSIERMSTFILNVSEQRARIGWQNNPISLPMTRQDIADYLGLTIETVSRSISELKKRSIIKLINKKQIFINEFDQLRLE